MHHLVQRGRDEAAQADDIGLLRNGSVEDSVCSDHDSQVDDVVAVAAQNDSHDVLADVMHVAFDRSHDDLAARRLVARFFLLGLHEWQQVSHGLLHDTRALDHLREKHFSGAEQIADDIHPIHERPFDDGQSGGKDRPGLVDIALDMIGLSLDQRMRQALRHSRRSPGFFRLLSRLAGSFDGIGVTQKALGGVGAPVEQNVLDHLQKVGRNLLVDG